MLKMNKKKFLKTEFGAELDSCVKAWDKALDNCCIFSQETEEYKRERKAADWCQAQWEVYQKAIKQFYGIEYHFTRTDEYFGVVTEEDDWLIKIER